jgi:hypothetical protein
VLADGLHPSSWKGLAEMAEAWSEFSLSSWQEMRAKAEEYREIDDERVLVFTAASGRGKTSGLELGQMRVKSAALFHIRGGKVTRLVTYFDRDNLPAFTNLGLKE